MKDVIALLCGDNLEEALTHGGCFGRTSFQSFRAALLTR
jgi:hypothetical protein